MLIRRPKPYHWQGRTKSYAGGKLAWFSAEPDEAYWSVHWKRRLSKGYLDRASKTDLSDHEFGSLLLDELRPGGRYLEAGCGAGYWVAALASAGYRIEGIEYSRDLVQAVQAARPDLDVRYGNALALDCPDETYDGYLSFGVIEHRETGPEPFVEEAVRVVRRGGKLIITAPHLGPLRLAKARLGYFQARPDRPFFQYAFTPEEIARLLQSLGCRIIHQRPYGAGRLLLEEVGMFRWLAAQRGGRYLREAADRLLRNLDGHMHITVAERIS